MRSRKEKRAAAVPMMAGGVLLLVAGLIGGVLWVSKLKHDAGGGKPRVAETMASVEDEAAAEDPFEAGAEKLEASPVVEEPESIDPFAGMDDPFDGGLAESTSTLKPEPGELTGSELWQGAMKTASRVGGRLMLATEAREKGKPAEEKNYRREARTALSQALQVTDQWAREEVSRFDPLDIQVRSVVKLRRKWIDQLAELKD